MTIFEQFAIKPIINAASAVTRLGGSFMPQQVLDNFCEAARYSFEMDQLQAMASREIAKVTGAEAGLVTAGSASSLTLGSAAIMCGYELARMECLPHVDGKFPDEFVVAREHRNGYDHAVRASGARLVEVGFHEIVASAGVRCAEPWEYAAAFGPRTAGVLFGYGNESQRILPDVVKVAHQHGIPVLVDAAGRVPPRERLRSILATGADLVAMSGGKMIRGPQSTGLLFGRRDLIGSAALQMLDMDDHIELWDPPADLIDKSKLPGMPRHGIGRAHKVSKEEIVALLTALRLSDSGIYDNDVAPATRMLEKIAQALEGSACSTKLTPSPDGEVMPSLEIAVNQARLGRSAMEVCRRLRQGQPSVHVGQRYLYEGRLMLHPMLIRPDDVDTLIDRLRKELTL